MNIKQAVIRCLHDMLKDMYYEELSDMLNHSGLHALEGHDAEDYFVVITDGCVQKDFEHDTITFSVDFVNRDLKKDIVFQSNMFRLKLEEVKE